MSSSSGSVAVEAVGDESPTGRVRAVRAVAALMAVGAVAFGVSTVVFWVLSEAPALHGVHNVVVTSLLVILSAPAAVAVAREPRASGPALAVLGVVAVAGLTAMASSLAVDPYTLPFVLLVGVVWLLRPRSAGRLPPGRWSPALLVLMLLAGVPLLIFALDQAALQRADHVSEHATLFHWVETAFLAWAVLLLGSLAAVRPAAFRLAGWCAGVALCLLGVASLALAGAASAVDGPWAWSAVVGGVALAALTQWEVHATARAPRPA